MNEVPPFVCDVMGASLFFVLVASLTACMPTSVSKMAAVSQTFSNSSTLRYETGHAVTESYLITPVT